jgi:predicted amidohydrolase YtcJ
MELPVVLLAQTYKEGEYIDMQTTAPHDVVVANGRVIDPETKLDAVRNIGIKNGKIEAVSTTALMGQIVVDAKGLFVAPGFIDWHVHGQNTLADRVQAFDGVTTALELEAGMLPIGRWYDLQAKSKRVLNHGASSSWGIARMVTLEGIPLPVVPSAVSLFPNFGLKKWPNHIATPEAGGHDREPDGAGTARGWSGHRPHPWVRAGEWIQGAARFTYFGG